MRNPDKEGVQPRRSREVSTLQLCTELETPEQTEGRGSKTLGETDRLTYLTIFVGNSILLLEIF